jgi:hypothetical protein
MTKLEKLGLGACSLMMILSEACRNSKEMMKKVIISLVLTRDL